MKVEVIISFYGRPTDDVTADAQLFNAGSIVDVPDDFGEMIMSKELAKAVGVKAVSKKETINETE